VRKHLSNKNVKQFGFGFILHIYCEANIGFKRLGKFVNSKQNTNIITITVPHTHDLQETTCVNMEIEVFDRKLHTVMKTANSVKIIQENLSTNNFTLHGLHQNISGKEKVAEFIGGSIKETNGKKIRNPPYSEMLGKSKGSY
jgi:hypothetical protein